MKSKEKANKDKTEEKASDIVEEQKTDGEEQHSGAEEEQESESTEPTPEELVAEAKDKYIRLYSEFENFRRRTSKEKLDLISTANRDLMSDLVPVLDDFERAMGAADKTEDLSALKEGMLLIQNKLTKSLENRGLKKMNVSKGDEFDDEVHEAITQIPAEGLEGKVVDVIEPGYKLGESVVRFAKVVVGAKQ